MKRFAQDNGRTTIPPRKVLAIRQAHAKAIVAGNGRLPWGWFTREAKRRGVSLCYVTQIIKGQRRKEG